MRVMKTKMIQNVVSCEIYSRRQAFPALFYYSSLNSNGINITRLEGCSHNVSTISCQEQAVLRVKEGLRIIKPLNYVSPYERKIETQMFLFFPKYIDTLILFTICKLINTVSR